jgi:uncharacterized protein YjiS (DUF1127 family)
MSYTRIVYEHDEAVNMSGKKIYGETKRRFTMTLTETAIQWLEKKQEELGANSLSDVVERLARERLDK